MPSVGADAGAEADQRELVDRCVDQGGGEVALQEAHRSSSRPKRSKPSRTWLRSARRSSRPSAAVGPRRSSAAARKRLDDPHLAARACSCAVEVGRTGRCRRRPGRSRSRPGRPGRGRGAARRGTRAAGRARPGPAATRRTRMRESVHRAAGSGPPVLAEAPEGPRRHVGPGSRRRFRSGAVPRSTWCGQDRQPHLVLEVVLVEQAPLDAVEVAVRGPVDERSSVEVDVVLEDRSPSMRMRSESSSSSLRAGRALEAVELGGQLGPLGRAAFLVRDDGQAEVDGDDHRRSGRSYSAMKSSSAVITPLRGPPSSVGVGQGRVQSAHHARAPGRSGACRRGATAGGTPRGSCPGRSRGHAGRTASPRRAGPAAAGADRRGG